MSPITKSWTVEPREVLAAIASPVALEAFDEINKYRHLCGKEYQKTVAAIADLAGVAVSLALKKQWGANDR